MTDEEINRYFGFSSEEDRGATEQRTAGEAPGASESAQEQDQDVAQGQEGDQFGLTGQTEAEASADAERLAKQESDKKRKESAPPSEEFTLTGSTRAADEGSARGQQDLIGAIESIKQSDDIPTADKVRLAAELRKGGIAPEDVAAMVGDVSQKPEKVK